MRLVLVARPVDFISLDEARQQCRVDDGNDAVLLQRAIDAAISTLDGYHGILRRCVVNQTWRMDIPRPGRSVRLPFPDVSHAEVRFIDEPPTPVPVEATHGGLSLEFGTRWGRPISITFTAGFGDVAAVPPAIKIAGLMLVDFFYNQRGGLSEGPGFPPEVDAMIAPFKVWRV